VEAIKAFFYSIEGWGGYFFLFLVSLGENLFPPMPGDTFVVIGAILVGRGQLSFWPAYFSTTAGSLLGFMTLYGVGWKWGAAFINGKMGRVFPANTLETVENWFGRYGLWVVGANRFMGGIRGVISLAAGIAKMRVRHVFLLAMLSCMIWNLIIILCGKWIGENWITIMNRYQWAAGGLVIILVFAYMVRRTVMRNLQKKV
jgi:membrane protein DedA with SNARE-associated domain